MNLLEYQSKNILAGAGIGIPKGIVLNDGKEANNAFSSMGLSEGVVKAQVPAGGRGISGGVRIVHSAFEAEDAARSLIGNRLRTPQTGPEGILVSKVLLEEIVRYGKEYYVAIAVNRSLGVPTIIFSTEGGKTIEDTARTAPEKVYKIHLDPLAGLDSAGIGTMIKSCGLYETEAKNLPWLLETLFDLFLKLDALLIEINPLAFDGKRFIALDAKITIDDNGLFRHPEILLLREMKGDFLEKEALREGISYVRLDGDVGCLVNGAGLAMATMDMINLSGRKPANFLDIGGSAHHEQVAAAMRILLANPHVKVIFVNIFGGIVHCDLIASEIVESVRGLESPVPAVVRLEGTGAEKGKRIIADSGLRITVVSDMEEGMERIKYL